MRVVLQRVLEAKVQVDGVTIGQIGKGFLLLIGVGDGDTEQIADRMVEKILKLRIFEDENGKTNLSLDQVNGQVLAVSQFTLYADCKKGNRPSFIGAGSPQMAEALYDYTVEKIRGVLGDCQHGIFGADMKISLVNDGPFTLTLDSKQLF